MEKTPGQDNCPTARIALPQHEGPLPPVPLFDETYDSMSISISTGRGCRVAWLTHGRVMWLVPNPLDLGANGPFLSVRARHWIPFQPVTSLCRASLGSILRHFHFIPYLQEWPTGHLLRLFTPGLGAKGRLTVGHTISQARLGRSLRFESGPTPP